MKPPYDPEIAGFVAPVRAMLGTLSSETLGPLRDLVATGVPGAEPFDYTCGGTVRLDQMQASGNQSDSEVPILIFRNVVEPNRPVPCMYYIHGGGMTFGEPKQGLESLLPYVASGAAAIVSVDYRLAPEHPDPAPLDDCYAGLVWVAHHAVDLGIDATRLILIGCSAGGGLAAGTALMARDLAWPEPSHQILLYPMLDDRMSTASSAMLDNEGTWSMQDSLFGWSALLGDRRGSSDVSIYAAPARATDLSRLPRTYLEVGSVDNLRDEVLDYASRLCSAGVSVDLHLWGGGFHGFEQMAPDARISQSCMQARSDFLHNALT